MRDLDEKQVFLSLVVNSSSFLKSNMRYRLFIYRGVSWFLNVHFTAFSGRFSLQVDVHLFS